MSCLPLCENKHGQRLSRNGRIPCRSSILLMTFVVIVCGFGGLLFHQQWSVTSTTIKKDTRQHPLPITSSQPTPTSLDRPHPAAIIANKRVDDILAAQSKTLAQAQARYTLRTGLTPPPHFNTFFEWASDRECLIDSYDQIQADFKPWYQLAASHPELFRQRLDRVMGIAETRNGTNLQAFAVSNGQATSATIDASPYGWAWQHILKIVSLFYSIFVLTLTYTLATAPFHASHHQLARRASKRFQHTSPRCPTTCLQGWKR